MLPCFSAPAASHVHSRPDSHDTSEGLTLLMDPSAGSSRRA